jgi:hypothetical protein
MPQCPITAGHNSQHCRDRDTDRYANDTDAPDRWQGGRRQETNQHRCGEQDGRYDDRTPVPQAQQAGKAVPLSRRQLASLVCVQRFVRERARTDQNASQANTSAIAARQRPAFSHAPAICSDRPGRMTAGVKILAHFCHTTGRKRHRGAWRSLSNNRLTPRNRWCCHGKFGPDLTS